MRLICRAVTFVRPLYVCAPFRMLSLAYEAVYARCLDLKCYCALYRLAVIRIIVQTHYMLSPFRARISLILLHYFVKAFRKFGQGFASFILRINFRFSFFVSPWGL